MVAIGARSAGKVVVGAFTAYLTLLNVNVLGSGTVYMLNRGADDPLGWTLVFAALTSAPFCLAALYLRRAARTRASSTVAWDLVKTLLFVAVVSVPFTLLVMAA